MAATAARTAAADADPERLGDREAERLDSTLLDELRHVIGRHRREGALDLVARSPVPVSWLKSSCAGLGRLAELVERRGGTSRRRSSDGQICSGTISVPKTVPTIARATVPPIWRKNVRFDVATPSMLERHGVLDDRA